MKHHVGNALPDQRQDIVGEFQRRLDVGRVPQMAVEDERVRQLLRLDRMEVLRVGAIRNEVDHAVRHRSPDLPHVGLRDDRTALEARIDETLEAWLVDLEQRVVQPFPEALRALQHLVAPERPRIM